MSPHRIQTAQRALRPEGILWRRLAYLGARHGPVFWLRYSPPVFGWLAASVLGQKRARVRQNLRRVLGVRPSSVEYLDVARTFAAYAACFAESMGGQRHRPGAISHRIRGEEHLDRVLCGDRGAVLATAHVGAWDLAARWLPSLYPGRSIVVVMASEADASARQLHDRVRARGGVRVAHLTDDPLQSVALLGELRHGSLICVQLDRAPPSRRTVTVSLFGEPFHMPMGPFYLAALAGVAVVPIFVARQGFLDYEVDIGAPIELKSRPRPTELEEAARRAAGHMEQFIRAHPTQWFHFEDR